MKSLNKDKKQLVHSYINYNGLFLDPLVVYIVNRSNYNNLYFIQQGKLIII